MATSNHKKQYTTLSDIDHVLLRPEVIIGSTVPMEQTEYVVDENFSEILEKQVFVSEALIRILWKYLPTQLIIFTEVRDLQHLVNQLKLK